MDERKGWLMDELSRWKELLEHVQSTLKKEPSNWPEIGRILAGNEPVDIALVLEELAPEDAEKAFATLDQQCGALVLGMLAPELTKSISDTMDAEQISCLAELLPDRDAAALLSEQSRKIIRKGAEAGRVDAAVASEAEAHLAYPAGTVGRIMTTDFIRLDRTMTINQALDKVRQSNPQEKLCSGMCVVEQQDSTEGPMERLVGIISIRDAVMADGNQRIEEAMQEHVVCVSALTESTMAARLLSKHKFLSLPITDENGFLIGVIPSEDLMQLALGRLYERYANAIGTDAAAMEQMSPAQAAKTRVPWLLGTMVIELGAAVLIDHFNAILMKVILLAAFMPVISAVSGNVGLQAAAITVRGLDAGEASIKAARHTLMKESATTLLMAIVCGGVLGVIGGVWSAHVMFGVVIGFALFCSMMTAAFMGTLFPMISKRLGFDPATTAGPFETAFQDVIGFGVFLGLATLFANRL